MVCHCFLSPATEALPCLVVICDLLLLLAAAVLLLLLLINWAKLSAAVAVAVVGELHLPSLSISPLLVTVEAAAPAAEVVD